MSVSLARELRRHATFAERILFRRLRAKRLEVKWRRQCPIGPFVVDFYCHEARLVVELDGASHSSDGAMCSDQARTAWLEASYGLRILRFTNEDVLHNLDAVLQVIY